MSAYTCCEHCCPDSEHHPERDRHVSACWTGCRGCRPVESVLW